MKVNKLALGTVQFGFNYGVANQAGKVSLDEAQRILSLVKEHKIDVLDTAISYGASEEVLGKVGVDGFRLVTKLPSIPEDQTDVPHWVIEQVCQSLARLGQKKLYGLLLHRAEDLSGPRGEQLIQGLRSLKNYGVVDKIGVSIYSPYELDQVYKKINVDLVQAPLNVIDRRLQSSGWLDRLKDAGVEVHTRSTFLQGLLLMRHDMIPKKFLRWSSLWDQWREHLERTGISALAACLAYPLSHEDVDRVIVGVDSAAQLGEIVLVADKLEDAFDTSFMRSSDQDLINPSNWDYF